MGCPAAGLKTSFFVLKYFYRLALEGLNLRGLWVWGRLFPNALLSSSNPHKSLIRYLVFVAKVPLTCRVVVILSRPLTLQGSPKYKVIPLRCSLRFKYNWTPQKQSADHFQPLQHTRLHAHTVSVSCLTASSARSSGTGIPSISLHLSPLSPSQLWHLRTVLFFCFF